MLRPVSTTVGICCLGYAALNTYALPGSAISEEAASVTRAVSALIRDAEKSQALFGSKTAAISQLKLLANECSQPDWDGSGAFAIDPLALLNAKNFIRALPEDIPMPEFAPEPDGAISLDWIHSRHRFFSLSIGSSNRFAYAWLDGSDKGHGVARYDGHNIPARVLAEILSIVSQAHASVRAT